MTNYKDSGVDIELGDDVSKIMYNASKQTWKNRNRAFGEVIVPNDDFSGVRVIDVGKLRAGTVMGMDSDGTGNKMLVAQRMGIHNTIAYDLMAMIIEDSLTKGAEPVLVQTDLSVNSLSNEKGEPFTKEINQLAQGYIRAANAANVAIITGEVAELGNTIQGYGDFNYVWSGSVVWFQNRNKLFTGNEIQLGDKLVALKEDGFRSNGLTLAMYVLNKRFGDNWHNMNYEFDGKKENIGELVLEPSKIYTPAVCTMFGRYDVDPQAEVHGVAHITGGGLPGKLGRMLKPTGLGAIINAPFEQPAGMRLCQNVGDVSDEEAYKTWNMGQGMVVATPKPDEVIQIAQRYGIEAKEIGRVRDEKQISILSNGFHDNGKLLNYDLDGRFLGTTK